ncbi:hypothetical protein [Chitinophaga varians]|nr:hypothetical protein [Chitinophaga varians]
MKPVKSMKSIKPIKPIKPRAEALGYDVVQAVLGLKSEGNY